MEKTYKDLVFRHGLTLIPIKAGTKVSAIAAYNLGRGISAKTWHKYEPGRQYACCPHFADLTVIDFDSTAEHSKAELAAMPEHEAKECMLWHLQNFYAKHPDLLDKIVCMNWSGSGRGLHLWFSRKAADWRELAGRPKFASGEIFDGAGYVLIYDPRHLLASLNNEAECPHEPISTAEVRAVMDASPSMTPSVPIRPDNIINPSRTTDAPVTADDLIAIVGTGTGIGFSEAESCVLHALEQAIPAHKLNCAMHTNLTDAGAQHPWTPNGIAHLFARIPDRYWDDYHFWLWSGMALRSLSVVPQAAGIAFGIWQAFSARSHKFDPVHQYQIWNYIRPASMMPDGKARTMGSMVYIAGRQDRTFTEYKPVDLSDIAPFAARIEKSGTKFISGADLHAAYLNAGGSVKRKTFSKAIGIMFEGRGIEKTARRGQWGWKGIKIGAGK